MENDLAKILLEGFARMEVQLERIAREVTTTRQLTSKFVNAMDDAESEIPESYRRFVNAFHDVHDIKFMNEEHGATPPDYVLREVERLYDRYRQLLERLNAEGGAFNKVRREMAADPFNRYDHTRLLTKAKENGNEAGSRE